MFALIRKDLIACRLFLVIGLVMYVLWAVSMYQQPLGFFMGLPPIDPASCRSQCTSQIRW